MPKITLPPCVYAKSPSKVCVDECSHIGPIGCLLAPNGYEPEGGFDALAEKVIEAGFEIGRPQKLDPHE